MVTRRPGGFTIIELVVTLVVLGIVAAVALLAVWFRKRPAMEFVRVR